MVRIRNRNKCIVSKCVTADLL